MIKLLHFLFIFTALYSQENTFRCPENHSNFIHKIAYAMQNSSSVLILSPSIHHTALSKGILSAAKHRSDITMILHNPHEDPLSLIQYDHVTLNISTTLLHESLILIDNTLVCTTNSPLEEEILNFSHATFRCSDSPEKIEAVRHAMQPVIKNSKSYLK